MSGFLHSWYTDPSLQSKGQTRASRARESSVTHKSAIAEHIVEEKHVIDWGKAKMADRKAQQQIRLTKKAHFVLERSQCASVRT